MNGVRLVIVVPCYNEEEVLKETTRQLSDVLARMEQEGKVAEGKILYVDDGSKDTTWKLIEQLSESHRCVAGLKLAHNVGHQQALWAGLDFVAAGDYDAAVSIDADLQDDVNAIVEMVDYYNQGADVVFGVRRERKETYRADVLQTDADNGRGDCLQSCGFPPDEQALPEGIGVFPRT